MSRSFPRWPFVLFFLSGFSGLVYQIVWLRLAFAAFGVVTPVISVVLSVFMFGLGIGSWLSGAVVRRWPWQRGTALRVYSLAEFLIGVGGVLVPLIFQQGAAELLTAGESDSVRYLVSSAGIMALALAPFCLCMGTTFPFMLQAIRAERQERESFSFLYLANVLGALCGTLLTPLALVELFGLRGTLAMAVAANWLAGLISLRMSVAASFLSPATQAGPETPEVSASESSRGRAPRLAWWTLFTTGMTSMGMEIVWTRAFMPVLKTQVYSFAGLLFTYLLATGCGSAVYRRHLARGGAVSNDRLLGLLSLAACGQLLLGDPRITLPQEWLQAGWLLVGIVPYCGLLGYLTPKLIDETSQGRPGPAGRAYAINVLGCIVGPLAASYVLLPRLGVHASGLVLAAPLWVLAGLAIRGRWKSAAEAAPRGTPESAEDDGPGEGFPRSTGKGRWAWGAATVCGLAAAGWGTSYEELYAARGARVYRDHTATVIATTTQDGGKLLLVNGKPITSITPTTKLMAHLPLALLSEKPRSALVICFGMGTTYRSLLSWDVDVTAVELVPSVREAFGFFFEDADRIRRHPRGRIVIDDGRRFLIRTAERYDVITLDPPPPPEAAGSSLLYSREFYRLVQLRLTAGGILHQWFPGGELQTFQAVLRSVVEEFPHVQVMRGFDGWGYHILASRVPFPPWTSADLAVRLPEAARRDLLEWSPGESAESLLNLVLATRFDPQEVLHRDLRVEITDDRPYNEYYLLRRLWQWWTGKYTIVL